MRARLAAYVSVLAVAVLTASLATPAAAAPGDEGSTASLNAELTDGSVQRVKVRGPAAAAGPPRPGGWRVRGGRGPRDTYG